MSKKLNKYTTIEQKYAVIMHHGLNKYKNKLQWWEKNLKKKVVKHTDIIPLLRCLWSELVPQADTNAPHFKCIIYFNR